jgi:hypothetical protein
MASSREALHSLIDRLPETELGAAERFLEFLSKEPIGPEFAESIRRGLAEAERGQTVVCSDYGEMVDKVLGGK